MAEERVHRHLAAILAADAVGYSQAMGSDEEGTLLRLKAHGSELLEPKICEHRGRIFKTTGDGLLAEFASVVDALRCALEIQRAMPGRNAEAPAEERIEFRIGINVGDIIVDNGDVYGDGVNVATRLEGLAEPGGICVSARVQEDARGKLAVSFRDMGERRLKNIAWPVRAFSALIDDRVAPSRPTLPVPDKASIAVLPFDNLSGDPEQEYFADGMVEEIITALSRMRWMFVIARNSSFIYKGRAVDVKQVGRELGVQYVLEGSVRKSGDKVRITGQLIDATTGNHIWGDRYEGAVSDIFDLQDRITENVVGAIEPSILSAEIERSWRKRPESLVAYDFVLRAFALVWSLDKEQNKAARALLDRALSIEPTYPLALSLLAWCHAQRAVYNWTDTPVISREEGLRLAQKAAALSSDDPMVLAVLGAAHSFARDFDVASAHLERARTLDPNSAWAWVRSAWLEVYREQPAIAVNQFEHAMRLSPFDPMGYISLLGIGASHFVAARYDEAVVWTRKGLNQQPDAAWGLRQLVTALSHAGRKDEAERECSKLMESYPELTIRKLRDALPFGPGTMERIASGLREAGLPE